MSYHELEYGKDERGQPWRDRPLAYLRENEPDYNDAMYLVKRWPKIFRVPDYFASGDYHGSFWALSNYQWWNEEFASTFNKTWWDLGQEGGILVRLNILPDEQRDALKRIDRHGYADEDHVEAVELETRTEQWGDYGRDDFIREINAKAIEEDQEAIEALLEVIPNKVLDRAWSHVETATAEGLTWLFKTDDAFIDNWDGSLAELLEFLGLETTAKVIVRLADTAFTNWKPVPGWPGQRERSVAITPEQLQQSAPDALSPSQIATLLRNAELRLPFDALTGTLCSSLYLECEYPWGEEGEEEEEAAQENPKTPPKALADKAVAAMRVYLGSVGKVQYRQEQKLYDRARKAIEKMAQSTGAGWNEWWPAVEDAARKEGLRTAMPGKDI